MSNRVIIYIRFNNNFQLNAQRHNIKSFTQVLSVRVLLINIIFN